MKKKLKLNLKLTPPLSLFAICLLASFTGLQAEETGRNIMDAQKSRHQVQSEQATDVIMLIDRKGNKEQRIQKRMSKRVADDVYYSVNAFTEPADIRGTALLIKENKDIGSDQWVYFPAQKKVRRVAPGIAKRPYMGTDFTYEDLKGDSLDNYNYEILREEPFQEHDCWVIQVVPANDDSRKKSAYSKRILWVRKDIYMTTKIEFYNRREKLAKTQTCVEIEKIGETAWRAKKLMMENHIKNHKTLILTRDLKIDEEVSDDLFTEQALSSGILLQ